MQKPPWRGSRSKCDKTKISRKQHIISFTSHSDAGCNSEHGATEWHNMLCFWATEQHVKLTEREKKMERDAEKERKVRGNVTMNNLRILRQKSNKIAIMIQYIQVLSIYLHTELHRHTHIIIIINNNTINKNMIIY